MPSDHTEPTTNELSSVTMQLRRVTRVVDRLCEVALLGTAGGRAMQLGEASRSLHQALIAIEEAAAPAVSVA